MKAHVYGVARLLAVLVAAWLGAASGEALAQEKHKSSFKTPPGATKFGQTQVLEVGDVPGPRCGLRNCCRRTRGTLLSTQG